MKKSGTKNVLRRKICASHGATNVQRIRTLRQGFFFSGLSSQTAKKAVSTRACIRRSLRRRRDAQRRQEGNLPLRGARKRDFASPSSSFGMRARAPEAKKLTSCSCVVVGVVVVAATLLHPPRHHTHTHFSRPPQRVQPRRRILLDLLLCRWVGWLRRGDEEGEICKFSPTFSVFFICPFCGDNEFATLVSSRPLPHGAS